LWLTTNWASAGMRMVALVPARLEQVGNYPSFLKPCPKPQF